MSAELAALKIELKSWENEFENTYGRKPTPDDIRAARLVDKYRKWKALKRAENVAMTKAATTVPFTPPRRTRPSTSTDLAEPTSVIITRTKSVVQDRDRDPEPLAAKVNPFSPPRPRPVAEPSWTPFASILPSGPSIPQRVPPFPPPSAKTNTNIIDEPDNPFLATPTATRTLSSSQADSPFTKARKRLRGEDVEMEGAASLPDKKRRFLNRSQSASQSTIWSRGGSAANALCPNPSPSRRRDKDKDMDDEMLGPTPRKKSTFRPIFDDSPLFALEDENANAKVSRTNSLPPGMQLFGKKKGDFSKRVEKMEEGHVHVQLPVLSSSNAGMAATPGKRKRSGSGTGPEWEVEVEAGDRSVASVTGPVAVLGLIPPSPPSTKENEQQQKQQQQQQRLQWKGKGKPVTGKGKKKAKIVPSEGTSGEEYNTVEELAWKPVGPLKRRSQAADIDAEPDLELELEDSIIVTHSKAKHIVTAEEPEQEGDFEIDLPDHLRDILTLAPSKRGREDEETIVRNLLAGKREFLSKVEIWAAGEVPEGHDGDEDDDWDGEPVGWWEAEL